ncbi:hypothetical protein GQ44DRAFT_756360 [Phaeosphaeriaceae sp. PMI808]|nr:hypothetical protein GQ44DRAFT_756360 [Phaeosphaeriaceae sp. PMI808]
MRLLKRLSDGSFGLTSFNNDSLPPYAILSHTWTEGQEVTYNELVAGIGQDKAGYAKIRFCGERAAADSLDYFWVDTCCIDKSTNDELSTAINSMFRWYQRAHKCYVFLSDVCVPEESHLQRRPSCTVPFERDRDFVDRGTLLEQIRGKCNAPASRTALVGLGGVGKSQLAIEHCYRTTDKFPQTWVFWVHASNAARVEQGYRDIADQVRLVGWNDPQADIFKLVHNWLRNEQNGKWLLVLDNVDDAAALILLASSRDHARPRLLSSHLPRSKNGSVLLTSRTRSVALQLVEESDILSIQPMDDASGAELLRKKLGEEVDKDGTAELARTLEFMPLALVQAAAYIRQRAPRFSVQQYLEEFYKNDKKRTGLLDYNGGHLRRDEEAKNSILITQGGHGDVENGDENKMQSDSDSGVTDSEESLDDGFEEDILMLRNYSFIGITTNATTFDMHRLVQLATRKWLEEQDQLERWKQQYINHLCAAFPTGDYENWVQCQALFPHATSALSQPPKCKESLLKWAKLLYNAAWYAWKQGNISDAEKLAVKSMKTSKKLLGKEHVDTLNYTTLVGLVVKLAGRWKEAEELEVHVMEIRRRVLGEEHPDTITSMGNLASTFRSQGRLKEAEELQVHVMETRKRVLGEEHPDTITSMGNLASTFWNQGRLKEAEELDVQVMEIKKRVLGEEHPDTITSIGNLASTFRNQGRLKEAEELELQVMEISKRVLGEEHPDTLMGIGNLASTFRNQGRWKEAEELELQVIEIRKRVLGEEHPDTLMGIGNLASTFWNQGRLKEAEELDVQVMEIKKRVLGEEHPDTITSIGNLASTFWNQGRLKEAEELQVQVMEISKRVLGEEHPDTLTSMANLAFVLKSQSRDKEALSLLEASFQLRKHILGEQHPKTKTLLDKLNEWQNNISGVTKHGYRYYLTTQWWQTFVRTHEFSTHLLSVKVRRPRDALIYPLRILRTKRLYDAQLPF